MGALLSVQTTRKSVMSITIQGRAALIVNECQRGVIERGLGSFTGLIDQVEERGIVPRIAALANAFRARALPVIHAPVAHRPDFSDVQPTSLINALTLKGRRMVAGTPDAAFVDPLKPHENDLVVERSSGLIVFIATALDALLRRMDVETVVLTGVSTNLAIAGCAIAAQELGYHVIIPEDCIAGADANTHRVIVQEQLRMIARISSATDVRAALD
jgi:nicotinamidase-related amidase